ncbi:hypothetical protein [Arthrobacter sp. SPG23]|uniref:hypothetical protein n=1 Tax=Arthrobacter sp. SPG23 TaxID=1610703 RepID=UPI0011852369|nr:hypothetical protein [Arthrobacter sp. SPG23]
MPSIPEEEDRPVRPAELVAWISVEVDDEPEIAEHRWLVELDDAVGLLVRPDHDDLADLLGEQAGVRSVIQLDREVFAVDAPRLCADGLRAAVTQAVAAANRRAHDTRAGRRPGTPAGDGVAWPDTAPTAQTTQRAPTVEPPEDDDLCRLVAGDASSEGRKVQIWVNRNGILILPAGTIPHGPLDQSENPHFQRATVTPARAAGLARRHAGRWIPYSSLSKLRLRRPGLVRRRWTATVVEQSGASVPLSWRGTRPHALLFWGYVVARCGLGTVDGLP